MKPSRKALIALAVVAAVVLVALLVQSNRTREPVYEGKRLSEWMKHHGHNRRAMESAMRATGTNALPLLMEMLEATDSKLTLWTLKAACRQPFIDWRPVTAYEKRDLALKGLSALGESAQSVLPRLKELFLTDSQYWQDTSFAIGQCDPDAVIFFTDCLKHKNHRVRCMSAIRLGFLGNHAKPAILQLIAALQDEHYSVRSCAARALSLIDNESDEVLSALMPMLNDTDDHVRGVAAVGIGEFGPRARAAVEQLKRMSDGSGSLEANAASLALEKILSEPSLNEVPEVRE